MFRLLLRLVLIGGFTWMAYKGLLVHAAFKMSEQMPACVEESRLCEAAAPRDPAAVRDRLNAALRCVKREQSWLQAIVLPIKPRLFLSDEQSVDYSRVDELCEQAARYKRRKQQP